MRAMSYCGSKNSKTELSVEPLDSHIDLFDLLQGNGPAYDQFAESNTVRLYGFLDSMIHLSGATQRHILSESMIKAINFHAIAEMVRKNWTVFFVYLSVLSCRALGCQAPSGGAPR